MCRSETIQALKKMADEIRTFGATGLFLYGSAARDELTEASDVDLFIDYDPASDFSFVELVRLQQLLQVTLQREVDLTTRAGLHPLIRADIEQSSVRVL
jgi:uncharacterized protein